MITDTSWVVVRHPHAFVPKPWQVVLCKRDTITEVLPGIQERRFRFAIDVYSGKGWSRKGSGQYEYWTNFPPIEQWCPVGTNPPFNALCVFWLHSGQYTGLQIGQVVLDALSHATWQVREPYTLNWTNVLSKNIGSWLLLPPT